jgi:hypothetical protein
VRVGFGRGPIPEGRLPVFSTNTEEEAKALIVLTCQMDMDGHYYARELAEEQTLERLQMFSDRLQRGWEMMKGRKVEGR